MKKLLIQGVFITSLLIANVVAGKVLDLHGFIVPGALFFYAFTFLSTDVMSELYGRREANNLVKVGFICAIFAAGMILLTQHLPAASFASLQSDAYDVLLGVNFRIMAASMVAYYSSQTWDVWMFHKIGRLTKGRHKWIRNNVSTLTSQLIDTVIFILIAFWGVVPNIGWMILSYYGLKLVIAVLDTPFFYLITKGKVGNFF